MQLPEISDTAVSNVVRLADGARKTRVLYAGDMDFAKAQFASVAPQLHLVPAAGVLTSGASAAPAFGDALDAALIDCGAPGVDARAVVDAIRACGLDLPIVLALDPGGSDNAATRVTAELRVDDYTVKLPGWLARLTSRLEFAIAHHRRRRSLEALQASAERLRTVVESAPVCLARVARDGTILAMNTAAMKMMSADAAEDVLGKSLLAFIDSGRADSVRRFLDTVSGGQPGSLEFETADAAGAARVVDTRAVPLSPDAEGRASALLVLRDATERKRLEDSMLEAAAVVRPLAAGDPHADERGSLRRQLDTALEECARMQAERDTLREAADEARARAAMVEHVRAACTAAEQQLGEMQAAYDRVVTERDRLAHDFADVRARHEAVLAEHQAAHESHQELARSAEAERAHLASRCDALTALVESIEARHAAEREEHRLAGEQAEADIRRVHQPDPLAAEREALLASLGALRTQFDEMSASLDAAEARHGADMRDQQAVTAAAEARLRDEEHARALVAVERDELRASLESARSRAETLQAALDASRAEREGQTAERDAAHRMLEQQIEELQARVNTAIAERDVIGHELDAAAHSANGRSEQLQAALDEVRAAREAQAAESEAVRRELVERVEELQAGVQAAFAERDAVRHEMRLALDAADARTSQLHATLDDIRARADTQAADSDSVRREFLERIDELQARVHAALAERDAARDEMRLALQAADARTADLQTALDEMRAARQTQAAEGDPLRRTLTQRVEELQIRLDAVIIDREALERALEEARAEHRAHLRDAAADRESLQRRLEERDAEYARLASEYAAVSAEASPGARPGPAVATAGVADLGLRDAQVAFREAFQLLSGELQTAVETTRAQQAALLRRHPAGYDGLEERVRQAEADCRRLAAERDERDTTVRALQAEIEQLIDIRREQRKELVRALQEADETERRAAARLAECARMRQMLAEAHSALQRLSKWAANQSARLGPAPVGSSRVLSRIEGPAARSTGPDEGASAPPLEASWS